MSEVSRTSRSDSQLSEPCPLDDIQADAILYRLMLRNEAEATLQALTARILRSMNMPNGSQIRIEADGSMVAVAPQVSE